MTGGQWWYDLSVRKPMKAFVSILLGATVAAVMTGSPVYAARKGSVSGPSAEAASDVSGLRLPDPHKELQYLSKNLKLTRHQRSTVDSILQERAREIGLILDVEPLSPEYRSMIAAKVIEDSNAQIEAFLKTKQRRKFDKDLARNPGAL
jgi:hypothetical protein